MTQRNSPARRAMLAARAVEQRGRQPSPRAPGFSGRRASINRRTGKPHEHARAKARHLRQTRPEGAYLPDPPQTVA